MFSDPISITYSGTAKSLPRVYEEKNGTRYSTAEGDLVLEIAHTQAKNRKRSVLRLRTDRTATDPFVAGSSRPVSATTYIVLDRPLSGFTHDELVKHLQALCDYLVAGTNAAAKKFAGGEA